MLPSSASRSRLLAGALCFKFHFDLANKDQEGPRHHLQIGGKAHVGDYHHGYPITGSCRGSYTSLREPSSRVRGFLGRTFYPAQFKKIAQDATWIHAVQEAEKTYVFPYLKGLPYDTVDAKKRRDSLFASVWNG